MNQIESASKPPPCRLPWELHQALTAERLMVCARLLVRGRAEAFRLADPWAGDDAWSIGCRAYSFSRNQLRQAATTGRYNWLGVLDETHHFVFLVEGVPVRFFRGDAAGASLPMPGGDAIGLRGIDFHVAGLRAMGAAVDITGGVIHAKASQGLHGATINLPMPSVGATENLPLAAVLANSKTVIGNAAREPEITDLLLCLRAMGAQVEGIGTHVLTIQGGLPLTGAVHTVMPDRIELGTVACAAAMTDGEVMLQHARADLLGAAVPVLAAAGRRTAGGRWGLIARRSPSGLTGVDIQTRPYPGFATVLQSPAMAMLTTARGAAPSPRPSLSTVSVTLINLERWAPTSLCVGKQRGCAVWNA